jgi:hypothetical protein
MRHTALASALLLFATIAAVRGAPADDTDPAVKKAAARRHFESGTLRFDEARYEEAIADFEAAYEITGAAEILYNIGRCHEELGHDRTAASYYERYLDQQPDAADAAEARQRMERLKPAAAAPAGEAKGEEPAAAFGGVRLGVTLGVAAPLTGEWDRVMVPFAVVLHMPLLDWLCLTGAVGFGGFAGEEPRVATGYPTGILDLMVGITGFKSLNDLFSLFGTLGVGSVFVFRDRHETAIWLDPRLAIGLAIRFFESWSATVEATGGYGPVFNPKRTDFDPWGDPPGPTADVGGRLGIFYAF